MALLLLTVFLNACSKHPDDPPAVATPVTTNPPPPPLPQPPPTPPPVTNCQGATVPWQSPSDWTINDNSSKTFTVPGFDVGCGDSLRVFIRKDSTQSWYELFNVNMGASYYSLAGNVVTVYNMTGIVQEVNIQAILK